MKYFHNPYRKITFLTAGTPQGRGPVCNIRVQQYGTLCLVICCVILAVWVPMGSAELRRLSVALSHSPRGSRASWNWRANTWSSSNCLCLVGGGRDECMRVWERKCKRVLFSLSCEGMYMYSYVSEYVWYFWDILILCKYNSIGGCIESILLTPTYGISVLWILSMRNIQYIL